MTGNKINKLKIIFNINKLKPSKKTNLKKIVFKIC
jgi:hypothetical protein